MELLLRSRILQAGLLAVASLGLATLLSGCGGKTLDAEPRGAGETDSTLRVLTVHPRRETLQISYTTPGYVEAWARVPIVAKANGYLESFGQDRNSRPIDIGSRIQKGQVLAQLSIPEWTDEKRRREADVGEKEAMILQAQASKREAEAQVAAGKAKLAEAKSAVASARADSEFDVTRYNVEKGLYEKQARPYENLMEAKSKMEAANAAVETAKGHVDAAQADLQSMMAKRDTAEAMIATARASLAKAKADLQYQETIMKYLTVRAPFDGCIVERETMPGDFIHDASSGKGRAILVAEETDVVRVFVDLPESDAVRVQGGEEATLQTQSYPEPFKGQVTRFAPSLDPETRTIRVEIDFPNRDDKLFPGMYGTASIVLEKRPNVVSIPNAAVVSQQGADQKFAFKVVDGKVQRTPIVTGFDNGIRTEVVSGLAEADQVLVSNLGEVVNGQVVVAAVQDEAPEEVSNAPEPVAAPSTVGIPRKRRGT